MSGLRVVTPPMTEPVSLDEMKQYLRVSISDDDELIAGLIQAAREDAESFTNRSFIKQTFEQSHDWFPLYDFRQQGYITGDYPAYYQGQWFVETLKIKLYKPTLIAGSSSVSYMDTNGQTQTIQPGTNYVEDATSEPARLLPLPGNWWPWVQFNRPAAVKVQFSAGYGDETALQAAITAYTVANPTATAEQIADFEATHRRAAVPAVIKTAIKLMVVHWYDNRAAVSQLTLKEVPLSVERLLCSQRVMDFSPTR